MSAASGCHNHNWPCEATRLWPVGQVLASPHLLDGGTIAWALTLVHSAKNMMELNGSKFAILNFSTFMCVCVCVYVHVSVSVCLCLQAEPPRPQRGTIDQPPNLL
jgi:hypothetical protein